MLNLSVCRRTGCDWVFVALNKEAHFGAVGSFTLWLYIPQPTAHMFMTPPTGKERNSICTLRVASSREAFSVELCQSYLLCQMFWVTSLSQLLLASEPNIFSFIVITATVVLETLRALENCFVPLTCSLPFQYGSLQSFLNFMTCFYADMQCEVWNQCASL